MLAVVVYGFSRTVGPNLLHSNRPHRMWLALHGVILLAWMLFFVVQSALIRARKIRLHRMLGWFGAANGLLCIIGLAAITIASAAPLALRFVGGVSVLGFGIPFVLAIVWRRRPELHRRLLLIATAVLTNAAFARFPSAFHPNHLFFLGTDAFILVGVLRDIVVTRRLHPVYAYGATALFASEFLVMIPAWHYLG